jgi:VWFA-related protein
VVSVILACLAPAFLEPAWADDPVVFHSDVSLVRVDAQVVDRSNRPIAGLGPRDFVLRDNGRVQKIQSVDAENLPVDLLLLLDVSASMRPHIQRITDASHEAMRQLRDEDRVAIMVFDRYTRVRMAFRNSQSNVDRELQRLLDQESFHGGTDITLGLMDAAAYIRREGRPEARRAIVIVTDDETERNKDVEGVSRELARADAVLSALIAPDAMGTHRAGGGYPGGGYPGGGYPGGGGGWGGIILGGGGGRRGRYPGGAGMGTQSAGTREIAERSGGDSMAVDNAYALQDTLARIRERYALHFALPPGVRAGDERNIELQLADATRSRYSGADVRYRRSYYAPVSSPAGSGTGDDPIVVSSAGPNGNSTGDDPDRPRLRRPGVSQPSSGGGPLVVDDGNARSNPPASGASQPDQTAPKKADAPQPPAPKPDAPGWRKARPEDLPH